jgi:signal transduction histidine kinase/CheY-like chemotaxis protein
LIICLFLHLTLLIGLAIYLVLSLDSMRRYAPVARDEEARLESLDLVPVLLGAMDVQRAGFLRDHNATDRALFDQNRRMVEQSFDSAETPIVPLDAAENQRRAVAEQWIKEIGEPSFATPAPPPALQAQLAGRGRALLDRLVTLSGQARSEVEAMLQGLQIEESSAASDRVSWMWIMVWSVIVFTIVIQLLLANSIVGPLEALRRTVRQMQNGDYTARVRISSGDEIESLGDTFNAMAENIRRSQRELQEKNERLSAQQEALRTINASLEERVGEKTEQIRHTLAEIEDRNLQLRQAARLKDEFIATLSHELRTPLTPIVNGAELIAADPALGEEGRRQVQVISRNARVLARMIGELLDLSSVMNRKLALLRERVELNEWAEAGFRALRPSGTRKKLRMTFEPAPEKVELEIDPARVDQIFTNLVSNAVKFVPAGGSITVRVAATAAEARLSVSDDGPGLEPGEKERIFEIFHQSPRRPGGAEGGLGVGLAVARSLAELHGGTLTAESDGPGRGSTFTLTLPRPQLDAKATGDGPPKLEPVDHAALRGRRVLIVEDADDTRDSLQRILERRGCRVTVAASGEEALVAARRDSPELILSDIGLPGISGLELIARLREDPALRGIAAVALSGLGQPADIDRARAAGFHAHLLKPVDLATLDRTLIEALEGRSGQG